MSTFRGHFQGRSIVFEVAAILATGWLLKQFRSPHLLRPAVGFIVGLHLSGLGEWKHWFTPRSARLGSAPLCSEQQGRCLGLMEMVLVVQQSSEAGAIR